MEIVIYERTDTLVSAKRRLKSIKALKSGWTPWQLPVMTGYRMGCCECGLVHEVEFEALRMKSPTEAAPLDTRKFRVRFRMKREI